MPFSTVTSVQIEEKVEPYGNRRLLKCCQASDTTLWYRGHIGSVTVAYTLAQCGGGNKRIDVVCATSRLELASSQTIRHIQTDQLKALVTPFLHSTSS